MAGIEKLTDLTVAKIAKAGKDPMLETVECHLLRSYMRVGSLLSLLRLERDVAARALEFMILTASRIGEALFAKWDEIDLEAKAWVIPAARMKHRVEHRVPLADDAIAILESTKGLDPLWVFPSLKGNQPMSSMALRAVLERIPQTGIALHEFRLMFRSWADEQTKYAKELREMALAHSVRSTVETGYVPLDLFEQYRAMMTEWANWCKIVQHDRVLR